MATKWDRRSTPQSRPYGKLHESCPPPYGFSSSIHLGNAPEPRFFAPFSHFGLLMGAYDHRVDHSILIPRILHQYGKYLFPDTRFLPTKKTVIHALPSTVLLRQVLPEGAAAQYPHHAIYKGTLVCRHTVPISCFTRKHSLNPAPLLRRQFISSRHRSLLHLR
jgi:hypothetical protein